MRGNMMGPILALGLAVAAVPAANAEPLKRTGQLYEQCAELPSDIIPNEQKRMLEVIHCNGYFNGILNTIALDELSDPRSSTLYQICLPPAATAKQAIRVFRSWAERHPELHHIHMSGGVVLALREGFPC